MNIRKTRLLLTLVAALCVFTNCAPPMGPLWDSDSGQFPRVLADSIWTIPLRMLYDTAPVNNGFRPSSDLLVFIAFEGLTYEIPIDEVEIQISSDPLADPPTFETIFNGNGNGNGNGIYHRFIREGRYLIRVVFQGKYSAPYSVQVGGLGTGPGSGPGNPDDGFQIIWRPLVTFDSNGGSRVPSQRLDHGASAVEPPPPTRLGFIFGGWYANRSLTRPYDFSLSVFESTTLFARWIPL